MSGKSTVQYDKTIIHLELIQNIAEYHTNLEGNDTLLLYFLGIPPAGQISCHGRHTWFLS